MDPLRGALPLLAVVVAVAPVFLPLASAEAADGSWLRVMVFCDPDNEATAEDEGRCGISIKQVDGDCEPVAGFAGTCGYSYYHEICAPSSWNQACYGY